MADIEYLARRLSALKAKRTLLEQQWRECFDYTYPLRGAGFSLVGAGAGVSTTVDNSYVNYARSQQARVFDDTATDSVRILASGLMSGNTPSSSRWFALDVANETEEDDEAIDDEQDEWLDEAAETLWKLIHDSNYDRTAYEAMIDVCIAGWCALYCDEAEDGGLHFEQWPLHQVWCAASTPGGPIDTVFRQVSMTAEQCVSMYGETMVSEKTRKQAESTPDAKLDVVQSIYPRRFRPGERPGKMRANMPFASCHWEVGNRHILRESGYHEFPVGVPRWMLIPDSDYPMGPVFEAMPSIKSLNKIKEMDLANMDLAIAGMWIAEDDGVLNPRTVKVGPRKVIVANSVDSMKPLVSGANFQVATMKAEELQRTIRKILMADQLEPQENGPQQTATEVTVRVEMIRQLLGPVFGRMQAEYSQWLVKRTFGLAFRAGALGMPPDSLGDVQVAVRYTSPMARSQRLVDVAAMDRYESTLVQEASSGKPEVLDNYDWDRAARERAELLGVPLKLMVPVDVRDERRAQRQAMQEQAQQQALGQEMLVKAAPKMVPQAEPAAAGA